MERRELWKTSVPLEHLEGVYVHGDRLWVHDGQWRGALLDMGTGDHLRSLEMSPPKEMLRSVLRPSIVEQRLRVEPMIIQEKLLLSITSANPDTGPDIAADEFGLILASEWDTASPQYKPIRFRPHPGEGLYPAGIHQGTYLTASGQTAFLVVRSLYDEGQEDSGPYAFSFYGIDPVALTFERLSEVSLEGENIGMAYRQLSIPQGWRALKLEQPICFDWTPAASIWTFRTLTIEASKDKQDFRLQVLIPVNIR